MQLTKPSAAFKALGLATLVIGASMAIRTESPLILVGSLVLGAIIGELMHIEKRLEGFGHWLQRTVAERPALAFNGAKAGG